MSNSSFPVSAKSLISGLVLAGGEGRRVGGRDKGLVHLNQQPLIQLVLNKLQPQVAKCLISANRNLASYRRYGYPVIEDLQPNAHLGPLAGILAAMTQVKSEFMLVVPCDCPYFPADLALRLWQAIEQHQAQIAVACSLVTDPAQSLRQVTIIEQQPYSVQPLFCLIRIEAASSQQLAEYLRKESKVGGWQQSLNRVLVPFGDSNQFYNFNTSAQLQQPPQ